MRIMAAIANWSLFAADFFSLGGNSCLTAAIDEAFIEGLHNFLGDDQENKEGGKGG